MWLGNAFISKCMWRQFNYYPTMSSSCIWPEQQAGSHSIWPCLWRHKWIITSPSNELETIKGSWGHIISIWLRHCRGGHVSRWSADLCNCTTSKNLEILCQCEYASPENLWKLMGTAWAWQYRHIRRDMFSEGILWQIWLELVPIFAILR